MENISFMNYLFVAAILGTLASENLQGGNNEGPPQAYFYSCKIRINSHSCFNYCFYFRFARRDFRDT